MNSQLHLNRAWCDYVKLAAAILVAVSHYSTVIVINNHWSDNQFLRFWCQGGHLGVAVFFFFSGYGLMESENKRHLGMVDFIKRRFSKVYLPVLFVSLLWIPIYYIIILGDGYQVTTSGVFYDIFWGFQDPVLWFIKILLLLYIFYCLFSILHHNELNALSHLVLIVGIGVSTYIAIKVGYPYVSIPLFGIGSYTSLLKSKSFAKIPMCYFLLALVVVLYGTLFILTKNSKLAHGVINCMVVALMLLCLQLLTNITPPVNYQHFIYQQFTQYTSSTLKF